MYYGHVILLTLENGSIAEQAELEGEGRALRGWQMMPRRLKQSPLPIIKHQQSDKGRVNPHTHNSVLGLSGIRVRV